MKNQNRFLPAAACAFGLCVSLTSGLYSRSLHARTLEPAPDLESWISEVKNASFPPLSVPRRLLLLESEVSDKSEVNFIVDGRAIEKISPFLVVDGPSADLSLRLNQESGGLTKKTKKLPLALRSSANVIIAGIRGKEPSIYTNDGQQLHKIGAGKPYHGDKSPESTLAWIYQCLGYDGIILGRKGAYVIVGGPASIFSREKIQALAIRGSDSQLALLDKKRSGVSLLELEASKGAYAIFRILALAKDSTTLPTATKLTIQRDLKNN